MKRLALASFLLFSLPIVAQVTDAVDKEREEHIKKLKDYQEKNPGWDSAPSDEYVSFFKRWNEESLNLTLKYHQKRCESDSSQCLSKKQERDLRSQYKIASDTIERQNKESKTKTGSLVTTPGNFGGDRTPAEDVAPPAPETPVDTSPETPDVKTDAAPETEVDTSEDDTQIAPPAAGDGDAAADTVDDKEEVKEDTPPVPVEEKEGKEDKIDTEEELDKFNDEEFPKNYDPQTCEWVEDMPRKIVYGPTYCSRQAAQICTGYVVCERKQGGGKFVRMSSCSPKNCSRSKEDAVACTLEQSFYSRRPEDERNHFVSPELKKVLTAPKVRAQ